MRKTKHTTMLRILLLLNVLLVLGCVSAQRYVILAPNVFYVGVPQTIHVQVYGIRHFQIIQIEIRAPTSFDRTRIVSSQQAFFVGGQSRLLSLRVDPEQLSQNHNYVYLVARGRGPELYFFKKTSVRLSYRKGILLLQTDKPIYTPKQKVQIRVVPLGFDLKISRKKVNIVVKNPKGKGVIHWKNLSTSSGFINKLFIIDNHAMSNGNWKIEAHYTHNVFHKVSKMFKVQKYVLPTFIVTISTNPRFILPTGSSFLISGKARYSNGRMVQGMATIRLNIEAKPMEKVLPLFSFKVKLRDGLFDVLLKTNRIKSLLQNKWLPHLEGHRLHIEADVTEKFTGKTERAVEKSVYFVMTPYRIEYVNTAQYFKPGLPFSISVRVKYTDGQTAKRIPMKLLVKAFGNGGMMISVSKQMQGSIFDLNRANTDENGRAEFVINIARQVKMLQIEVKTNSQNIPKEQNAVKELLVIASESSELMKLRQTNKPARVGTNAVCDAVLTSKTVDQLSYLVISRGQIVYNATIKELLGIITSISFKVTPAMSPSARLFAYYVSKETGRVVSDSILLEIEDKFPNPIFLMGSDRRNQEPPSMPYNIKILGTMGTKVGLLGVDQSVYLLSKSNILTAESVFNKLRYLNLGCGAGSGRNSVDVVKNTGMVMLSHDIVVSGNHGCKDQQRRIKRWLGLLDFFEEHEVMDPDFDLIIHRLYFPETWINNDLEISNKENNLTCRYLGFNKEHQCGSAFLPVTLPDTMTTWVVQAIGVSNTTGFGIAKPLHITTFKPFFIYLSMPYSVQRGEEITIFATIFNYKRYAVSVHIFLKKDKSFCSVTPPTTLSTSKTTRLTTRVIDIPSNDAISFPITLIPIKEGFTYVEVIALGELGDDFVRKRLLVVSEEEEKRHTKSFILNRKDGNNITTHLQMTQVRLQVPKYAISGSISAKAYFKGNVIEEAYTTLESGDVERILQLPGGNGKENMMRIAPNIYAFLYLTKTKQMTADLENKKGDYIIKGYRKELAYRKMDGSFASRANESSSTWLTAFAAKVFCQASQLQGIGIDRNVLCKAAKWLLTKQRRDGAFTEDQIGNGRFTSNATLTAFVLISLKECHCGGWFEDQAILRGTAYLEGREQSIVGTYNLALTAYALNVVNSTAKFQTNQKMLKMTINDTATSSLYWETGSRTRDIETAGYALLTQVSMNRLEYAGPISLWLSEQQEFGSIADRRVAVEFLAKYCQQVEMVNLTIRVKKRQLKITKDNAFLKQEIDISSYVGENLNVETMGTGIGQMQIKWQYKVKRKRNQGCDFNLTVKVIDAGTRRVLFFTSSSKKGVRIRPSRATALPKKQTLKTSNRRKVKKKKGKNKKRTRKNRHRNKENWKTVEPSIAPNTFLVTTCVQYKKPGKARKTVIKIGILTGFAADENKLEKTKNEQNTTIANYESSNIAVSFYLHQINSTVETCVTVSLHRLFEVGNLQHVPIKVYDYHKPEKECTVFYNLSQKRKSLRKCKDRICSCTQGFCSEPFPSIQRPRKTVRAACAKYDFAIKGKVLLVDEDYSYMKYDIIVLQVVKRGKRPLKKRDVFEIQKHHSCFYPFFKKNDIVFIMLQETPRSFILDSNAFAKKLIHRQDYVNVDQIRRSILAGKCNN